MLDYVVAMAIEMNIAEAKAKLSALVKAALDGEEVIIARDGVPAVRLAPVATAPKPRRRLGILKEYGWTGDTPYEVFAPEPEDALDGPLISDSPDS